MTYRLVIEEFGIPSKGASAIEFDSLVDLKAFFECLTNGSDAPSITAQVYQGSRLVFNVTKTMLNTYRFAYAG